MTKPMTPRLEAALERWKDWAEDGHFRDGFQSELYHALCEWRDLEPEHRFKVGDAVLDAQGHMCIISEPAWMCKYTGGNWLYIPERVLTHAKPIPDPLPDDHIDRFWVVGAWLEHGTFPGESIDGYPEFCVVLDDETMFVFHENWCCTRTRDFDDLPKTGWSFARHSPIQEKKEP